MINTTELLIKHLNTYDVKSYIHNPEIGRFKNFHILTSELEDYSSDVLYLLEPNTYKEQPELLKQERVNYLIFDMQYVQYDSIVAPSSNVIIITHYQSDLFSQIVTAIPTCCKAIRRYDKSIFRILNASLNANNTLQNLLEICADILQKNNHASSCMSSVININNTPFFILTGISQNHDFHASDVPLFFLLTDTLANYMSLYLISKKVTQPLLIRNFLSNLLTNKITDTSVMQQHADSLNLKFYKYNYLLILFNNAKKTINKNHIVSQYIKITGRVNYPACINGNHIVMLVSSKTEINDIITRVSGIDEKYLSNEPLNTMMISLSFPDITKLYETYTQCSSIINTICGIQAGSLIYQKNYLYQYSINQIIYTNDKKNFSIPKSEQIIAYDEEHATDYAITILVYLKYYMKINDAARVLNIHKNSLIYRIRRSTELFDIDYSDYPALNALQLSLEILLYKLPEY